MRMTTTTLAISDELGVGATVPCRLIHCQFETRDGVVKHSIAALSNPINQSSQKYPW
jgi:hypothetical protein